MTTNILAGFWQERQRLNFSSSIPAVIKTFEDTGRIRALTHELKDDEEHHIFYESDLAKWLEAVFVSLQKNPDNELNSYAENLIEKIISNQEENGYLNSFFTFFEPENKFKNLKVRHELYCAGHLMEAALEHLKLNGTSRFYDAMERYMDHIASTFGIEPGKKRGYPGHQEIELALLKAYEQTGKQKYLDLADYFLSERGRKPYYYDEEERQLKLKEKELDLSDYPSEIKDFISMLNSGEGKNYSYLQAHDLPVNQKTAEGHSVRALYMYTAMADLARIKKDSKMLRTCKSLWRNIIDRRLYVHGGVGSSHIGERFTFDYDLPNDIAYAETCASIALMFFAERLSRIERNSEYADIIEKALYNTILASTSANGKGFFYDNYLECIPEFLVFQQRRHGIRDEYHTCSCCPPNINRLIADLGKYIYSSCSDGINVHQYISSESCFEIDGDAVHLKQLSGFPWEGSSKLTLNKVSGKEFSLFIRVPEWDQNMKVGINGNKVSFKKIKGYAQIKRTWKEGDEVSLSFNLKPRVVRSLSKVRYNVQRACVFRGPLLYCIESIDNGPYLNQILMNQDQKLEAVDDEIFEGCISITGDMIRLNDSTDVLYSSSKPELHKTKVKLIPYFLWANRGENEMLVWINEKL
ncbi:MAG: glycoside hydrolase family 127 protein [bacterium]